MNEKKNSQIPMPLPADFSSVEAIIDLLKKHPDVAHFNIVMSDEIEELEMANKTHLGVPVKRDENGR